MHTRAQKRSAAAAFLACSSEGVAPASQDQCQGETRSKEFRNESVEIQVLDTDADALRSSPLKCPFAEGKSFVQVPLSPRHLVTLKEWEKRKEFVNFGQADHDILQELHLVAKTYADEVMEELYSQWLRFPELRRFFKDDAMLNRVRELQRRYFIRLTSGVYDAAYLEDRLRIGIAHKKIGLSPQWYMGAYSIYMQVVFPRVLSAFEYDRKKAHAAINALIKLVSLDQELAMLAYFTPTEAEASPPPPPPPPLPPPLVSDTTAVGASSPPVRQCLAQQQKLTVPTTNGK